MFVVTYPSLYVVALSELRDHLFSATQKDDSKL